MKKLLTLLLALVLVFSLVACSTGTTTETTTEADAEAVTLTGSAEGYAGPIEVTVTKNGETITDVVVNTESETPEIGGEALPTLVEAVKTAGTTEGVELVSGATVTSEAFIEAVNSAQ